MNLTDNVRTVFFKPQLLFIGYIYYISVKKRFFCLTTRIMTRALCTVKRRAEFFHSESKQKTTWENTTVKGKILHHGKGGLKIA